MNPSRSLSRRLIRNLSLGLVGLALLGAFAYGARDRLIQGVVRPVLVHELSRWLQAEVSLARLSLSEAGVSVEGFHVGKAGVGSLELKRLAFALDWQALRQKRVPNLEIVAPVITLLPREGTGDAQSTGWPTAPPLTIDAIRVRDGALLFAQFPQRGWRFDGDGRLGKAWSLNLTLQSLAHPEQTMALQSEGRWDGPLGAKITGLQWQDTELLSRPVTLEVDAGVLTTCDGAFTFLALTQARVRPLLEALGVSLPEKPAWSAGSSQIDVRWAERMLRFEAQLASLEIGAEGAGPQWKDLVLSGQMHADGLLSIEAKALLANSGDPLALQGVFDRTTLTFTLDHLAWRHSEILERPLLLSLAGKDSALRARLHLHQFDDRSLRSLLRLAAIDLPAEPAWSVRDLTLEPDWNGQNFRLTARAETGMLRWTGRELALAAVTGDFRSQSGAWTLAVGAGLGHKNRFSAELRVRQNDLRGEAAVELAQLEAVPKDQPGLDAPALTGALTLKADLNGTTNAPRLSLSATSRGLAPAGSTALPAVDLQAGVLLTRSGAFWHLRNGTFSGTLSGALSGSVSGRLEGGQGARGWTARLADMRLSQLAWTSEDGTSAFAGDRMGLQGEVFVPEVGEPRFSAQAEISGGEMLQGAYYFSFAGLTAALDLKGALHGGLLTLETGMLSVPELARLDVTGSLGAEAIRLHGTLDVPDLNRALEGPGRHLLSDAFPRLKTLSLQGALGVEAEVFRQGTRWGMDGRVAPRNVSVAWQDVAEIGGLDGEIPVQIGDIPSAGAQGRLRWNSLSASFLHSGPGDVAVEAHPGTLGIPGPVTLEMAGGGISLSELALTLPPSPREMGARLEVSAIDLQRLTQEHGWPEMRGTLGADLGRLTYRGGELAIAGEAAVDVFEGHISVRGMRVRELFSRYPVFLADIDFSGINLYNLTRTLSFGEMNGVVDGYVHQLSLLGTTPSHFQAELRTRNKGKRNISVKALKNLSILSQGGLSAALSRGIYRFIDFYRYRRIGFVCSLQNDVFRLRGTALDGSDRYLVYGGLLPPRIDVVTTSPVISFKEMVRRLKRLDRAGSGG